MAIFNSYVKLPEDMHFVNGKINYFDWAILIAMFDITRGYACVISKRPTKKVQTQDFQVYRRNIVFPPRR